MEDLDKSIDIMKRQKLISLIQENSVRLKKNNIRYTKNNQKHKLEHLDAQFASYERLLREISRHLLKIEKSVRQKYLVSMTLDRKRAVLANLNTEIELILSEWIKEYRDLYGNIRMEGVFDERVEATKTALREKILFEADKLEQTLNEEIGTTEKLDPAELGKIYDLDESTLVDLKAIEPLQEIHLIFQKFPEDEHYRTAFQGIQKGIKFCSSLGNLLQSDPKFGETVEQRKARKMKLTKLTLILGTLIHNLHILVNQVKLPAEQRNTDVIEKTWDRLEEALIENKDAEPVLENLGPLHCLLNGKEK